MGNLYLKLLLIQRTYWLYSAAITVTCIILILSLGEALLYLLNTLCLSIVPVIIEEQTRTKKQLPDRAGV